MWKGRAGLIASVMIGLLAITTAGVSTYAWFQANAEVRISASPSSAEITVQAPEDLDIDSPALYVYSGSDVASKTCPTHYTPVAANAGNTYTFWPGDKITFAVKIHATSGTINSGSMDVTYNAVHKLNREIYGTSTKVVSILETVNLKVGTSGDGTYPASMSSDIVDHSGSNGGILKSALSGSPAVNKSNTVSDAVDEETISSTDAYFFYTIDFIDDTVNGSTYYVEKDSSGNVKIDTPRNDNSTRYFTKSTSGNSTCYEGLQFNVTQLVINIK